MMDPELPSSYLQRFVGTEDAEYYANKEYGAQTYASLMWAHQKHLLREELLESRKDHPEGRHLDFACGTGRITRLAEEIFDDLDALDISPAMVELARKECPKAHFFVGNVLEHPELCPGPYTSITSFRLLLNLDPPLRVSILGELRRRLDAEGVLIVNVHGSSRSLRQPAIVWKRWRHPVNRPRGMMLNSMSPEEAVACLNTAGFQVERRRGLGILPPTLYRWPLRPLWAGLDRWLSCLPFLQGFCIDLMYVCRRKLSDS